MNCKPGDLAVIVCGGPRRRYGEDEYIGAILQVTSLNETLMARWPGYVFWSFDPVSPVLANLPAWAGVLDSSLRPIRDPGEDAKDESLSWLPVPSKEGAPA